MSRKKLLILTVLVILVILAIIIYYLLTVQKPEAQALFSNVNFELDQNNPNLSSSLTVPYMSRLLLGIVITNANPNSQYIVNVGGNVTSISTDANGVGSASIYTSQITQPTTLNITVSGPAGSNTITYTLNLDLLVSSTTTSPPPTTSPSSTTVSSTTTSSSTTTTTSVTITPYVSPCNVYPF